MKMNSRIVLGSLIATLVFNSILLRLQAQNRPVNYEEKWKIIDSLVFRKGLTETALSRVNSLYLIAKREKNDPQLIKSLIYKMHLQQVKQEDNENRNIEELQKEAGVMTEPAKSILNSILAETYWQYFQQNRWNIYDRTKTVHFRKEDIGTWGPDDFHQRIGKLYLASIREEKLLEQTDLNAYDPIIIKGNVRFLRPTLYDLLTHRALDYFKHDEQDILKSANSFEIEDECAFCDHNVFARHQFRTTDTSSPHFTALGLYQRLLLFHQNDARPDALLDVDIDRIVFVNLYGVMENRDSLYLSALLSITGRYGNDPAAAGAWYQIAQVYADRAASYDPLKDTSQRYAYLDAKKTCEQIVQYKDSSESSFKARVMLSSILGRSLTLQTEKVNVPGQPFRALVTYKNLDHFYLRVLSLDRKTREEFGRAGWTDGPWKTVVKLPYIRTTKQDLPDTKDYQEHRTEIRIDSLPAGEYALLASTSPDFGLDSNLMATVFFYVSDIAYINNGPDYFVLHRETGQPLSRTDVQVWYRYYDNKQNKYLLRMGEHMITDKNGAFKIFPSRTKNSNGFLLECTKGNDHLFMDDEYNYSPYYRNSEPLVYDRMEKGNSGYELNHLKSFLFTDRSIYRPGQIIFFKGLVITKDSATRQSKIVSGFKTKLILYDAGGQRIDSVSLTTSDFGSYHGSFSLPANNLNGEFRIEDDLTGSSQPFFVEEYKRPGFMVGYDSLKSLYHLGDTVTITGFAKAYAGNTISGAMVSYRVVRMVRFPYPRRFGRRRFPGSQNVEITHGETKSDPSGKFSVSFRAIPDHRLPRDFDPVFTYELTSDVTDINGETRSGETTVQVGYKSLELSITLPGNDQMPADSMKYLGIQSKTLYGGFEPARVNISMYRLAGPDRLIRERYWDEPDQFVMGKEEYLKSFPQDEYSHELQPESWEKKAKVFDVTDSTKPGYRYLTGGYPFIPGWYLLEVTAKDKSGQEVKELKYIQLYDAKTGRPGSPGYQWANPYHTTAEPGANVISTFGSSADQLFIIGYSDRQSSGGNPGPTSSGIHTEDQADRQISYDFFSLGNEQKVFPLHITESDRGGFGLYYAFIKNNRFYKSIHTISVPWTNKELQISYTTFRDKTLPGSSEKWKIKISGQNTGKLTAEVLTTMYDASLDQFKDHAWLVPVVFPDYVGFSNWSSRENFWYASSVERYPRITGTSIYRRVYDQLLYAAMTGFRARRLIQMKATAPQVVSGDLALSVEVVPLNKKVLVADTVGVPTNIQEKKFQAEPTGVQIRKNFDETAFFLPELHTDSSGNVEFAFIIPDALTRWKWMTLAHTKDLSLVYDEKSVISQKQLMIQPNLPRFIREGDKLDLSAKIANLTEYELTGQIQLQLFDPTTNQPVDGWFQNLEANQYFTVAPGGSSPVNFNIQVPFQYNRPLSYRILASAAHSQVTFSDGEESVLPVVSNRTLITETLPINVKGEGTKKFRFEKLLQSGASETLNHHALTVEWTANPAWFALQALPWLMEYPDECSEQVFDRFYANALTVRIFNSSPAIRDVMDKWRQAPDTSNRFASVLQKNTELKSDLLQETPWVLEAKNEAAQYKRLATLFEPGHVDSELDITVNTLLGMQSASGGFPWFKGGTDDRFITQYILTGIGRLKKLQAIPAVAENKINSIVKAALAYLDIRVLEDFEKARNGYGKTAPPDFAGPTQVQYLYMRSFFADLDVDSKALQAVSNLKKLAARLWTKYDRCLQAMLALAMHRFGQEQTARDILASLKENAITDAENGTHWKQSSPSYFWYGAPVESQSVLIEAFAELARDKKMTGDMKTWLLTQKQTQAWKTTKATADACYALLMEGDDWLQDNQEVRISLGDKQIDSRTEIKTAGLGYFKQNIEGPFVTPKMGEISVTLKGGRAIHPQTRPAWGAVYWQYFDELEKVTASSAGLRLAKKLFLEKNDGSGTVLEPVQDNQFLHPGDRVRVRMEIHSDRDLEFVHMKDQRASCLEPVQVLSGYSWQGDLGYYESVRDVSTDFFFDWMGRGTHVFEYSMFVSHTGNFSNGVASIQCMYAPEFSGHSEGIRLNVEDRNP